jgi:rhamnose transport system ATP-binding protein
VSPGGTSVADIAGAAPDPVAPLLELRGVSKSFPGVKALDDVSFSVRKGEVHALLGENGAGKSTLIKVLSGVHRPDSGVMYLDGNAVQFATPFEAQKAGIATIYQELLLFPDLTVAENIFMGHAPRTAWGAIDWPTLRRNAAALLASLDSHDLDVSAVVGSLSVGNRQRVEIAKALSHDARVLIMDEPTAALTEHDVERLFDIVRLLRERGVAVIYISHRLEEVFLLADRVTVLRDGTYVATKDVKDTDQDDLIHMMVGRVLDALFPKTEARIGEVVLEGRSIVRKPTTNDVSFKLAEGRDPRHCRARRVGPDRTRAYPLRRHAAGQRHADGRRQGGLDPQPAEAKALGIAYVPEDRGRQGLVRAMPVVENVSMSVLRRIAPRWFIDRLAEAEPRGGERQDLPDPREQHLADRRQAFGRQPAEGRPVEVAGHQPRILIMDEPTRGIDVGAKAEIHRLMSELAGEGLAILMISSELPEVLGMSDRILVMRGGRIVAEVDRATPRRPSSRPR